MILRRVDFRVEIADRRTPAGDEMRIAQREFPVVMSKVYSTIGKISS